MGADERRIEVVDCLPEDSWLRKWMAVWPNAEMPRSYLLFSAIAMIGAVYGRKVWIPQDWRKLYPMLNMLLIGPSGTGKTSALEVGFKYLIDPLTTDKPQLIVGKCTPEKLHWDLRSNPHSIIYAEELASFITKQKYMESLIPYLTELFNYKDVLEQRSKINDVITVEEPEAVLLGGSTVKWLQEQLPDSATAGGFLPRFLIIYEPYKYQKVALPDLIMGKGERRELLAERDRVIDEFKGVVTGHEGPIHYLDYGVADVYSLWYSSHRPASGHLEPFAQRAGEFIQRLAMLIALSCHRGFLLECDIQAGIDLYNYSERTLQTVVVPYTPKGQLLQLVSEAVSNNVVTQQQIRKAMRNYATAQEVDTLIESLIMSGELIRIPADNKIKKVG